MTPFLVAFALFCAFIAGAAYTFGIVQRDIGNRNRAHANWRTALVYVVVALIAAFGPLARAANVMELPGVATFTDERGECPRLWRVAVAPDGTRGCWTIGEVNRAITIRWPDGSTVEYSEMRFNIYARSVSHG